jgi:aldehyde dehydrogenase (NAD+)
MDRRRRRAFDHRLVTMRFVCTVRPAAYAGAGREVRNNRGEAVLGLCNGSQCDVPIGFIDYALQALPQFTWSRDIGCGEFAGIRSRRLVEKEAIGVVACITPWNVPLQINLAKCIPALAAGCTVILKAAPDTPWSATMLGRLVAKYTDIPAGVFNVITAEDPRLLGDQLVADPRVDMVSFTGSTAVGKHIMARAAQTVKKVFLELGGKSANILLDDADFGKALPSALSVCFHADRLRARDPPAGAEEPPPKPALLKTLFSFIQYGDPAAENQIMGPLMNRRQYERCLPSGSSRCTPAARGGRRNCHRLPHPAAVFVDVNNEMRIAQEEIFGPVLAVISYQDDEDAIRIANDSVYGLSGSVWSADEARALAVARRIRAGTINVNGGNFYAADAPFGGYKQSGLGREMGVEGFEEYLETKTIAIGL